MVYFVDANIFLRVLVASHDLMHTSSKLFLDGVRKNNYEACTSPIVLSEVVWTLISYYKFPKKEVIVGMKAITRLNGLSILDKGNTDDSLALFEKWNIKYIDCTIASIAELQKREWTLVSFDREFDKVGLLRKEPKEIVDN